MHILCMPLSPRERRATSSAPNPNLPCLTIRLAKYIAATAAIFLIFSQLLHTTVIQSRVQDNLIPLDHSPNLRPMPSTPTFLLLTVKRILKMPQPFTTKESIPLPHNRQLQPLSKIWTGSSIVCFSNPTEPYQPFHLSTIAAAAAAAEAEAEASPDTCSPAVHSVA